jgi:AGCS family alanine or glycine:cation symporter
VFHPVELAGAELPFVVLCLVAAAVYFTFSFRFVNVRGFRRALRLVRGNEAHSGGAGELTHFQALATAVSGTVGIGNIGGVAVAISIGGPGAAFWLAVAGLLGMSTKFVECTLGVVYRRENPDGSVSGGPMFYLEHGLAERGLPRAGRALGVFYASGIVVGCLGIGNMFQSNQAYAQLLGATGGTGGPLAGSGWIVGALLGACVGIVILGGVKSIARVTSRLVPFMAALYLLSALVVIFLNAGALPWALAQIASGAFSAPGVAGGAFGVLVIGFQRALFSNEAGIGSATIAHAAVRTPVPVTEGFVSLLEPFLDTLVICSATALVLVTPRYYEPGFAAGLGGIEMTSHAFERVAWWAPYPLALAAILFALSTMIAWSYYGLKGWTYLFGEGGTSESLFKAIFCLFIVVGAAIRLDAVLDLSDALVFAICLPNLLGLVLLRPVVARELAAYPAAGRGARLEEHRNGRV